MRAPYQHPAYRYLRDYQTVEFPEIGVASGGNATVSLQLPFNFVVMKLAATVKVTNALPPIAAIELDDPPLLTTIRYHNSPLDNTPLPLRNAWGTAQQPTIVPVPWAVKQGTSISVELTNILNIDGPIVPPFAVQMVASLSLIGYQPSDEEFDTIHTYNNYNFDRVYQTYTCASTDGKIFLSPGDVGRPWSTEFDLNFMSVKLTGAAFNFSTGTTSGTFAVAVPNPLCSVSMRSKGALFNTGRPQFRNIFGTARFPALQRPPQYVHQGDNFAVDLTHADIAGVVGTDLLIFPSLVGYVPRERMGRIADLERGRAGTAALPDPLKFADTNARKS